ncbi:MAG: SDR family oxidoreductase [Alphaproteobacteria bacterium]|nr:SDR family oxidoreductase [Alphaproteobacteria bacterium]
MGVLEGRTALVTGAASGIGYAAVEAFLDEGARVFAVDRNSAGMAPLARRGAFTRPADFADAAAAAETVQEAVLALPSLDIVFANAGMVRNALAAEMDDAAWEEQLAVNLSAPFRLARSAAPYLAQSPAGRFLVTASVMAEGTNYGLAGYCASKTGVLGLVRTLALEWGKHGVTANAILPGAIATGMTKPLWEAHPEIAELWAKKAALRRVGQPEDVARLAVFLASDAASFITGQAIAVDGGLTLRV